MWHYRSQIPKLQNFKVRKSCKSLTFQVFQVFYNSSGYLKRDNYLYFNFFFDVLPGLVCHKLFSQPNMIAFEFLSVHKIRLVSNGIKYLFNIPLSMPDPSWIQNCMRVRKGRR